MGNHDAGRAMAGAADAWWDGRGSAPPPTRDEALAALDRICGRWRGSDAEFDDEGGPETPLGRLIIAAFADPATPASAWADWDAWYAGPDDEFRTRFNLC